MSDHIVQSQVWGNFKSQYGTTSISVEGVHYTKHKIPFSHYYYAYCPKVNPYNIDFEKIKASLVENNCIAINFDVPNVLTTDPNIKSIVSIFEEKCVKAKKNTFAKHNIILDITPSEELLLAAMHHKHRYNIKYAQKNSVVVLEGKSSEDFEIFYNLLSETAERQKYFIHPKGYYGKIWEILGNEGVVRILTAFKDKTPLASWMLFLYDGVLYYPYGGSSEQYRNLSPSTLLAWEVIKFGKANNCTTFDMWGASSDPSNSLDPWFGFTNFKLRFGGRFVEYMDSYDFIINEAAYNTFSFANDLRWKILRFIR